MVEAVFNAMFMTGYRGYFQSTFNGSAGGHNLLFLNGVEDCLISCLMYLQDHFMK
ncbi:hypothetical protein [Desulfoscipio gibsoniae]|uniref:hypothetical protein n=1 Tax=Desulfoscipio gibsoniae TaxID=102134 RepID=UPI000232BE2D|nr:hypothetical protein [Desulfoscipio gibsoniae]